MSPPGKPDHLRRDLSRAGGLHTFVGCGERGAFRVQSKVCRSESFVGVGSRQAHPRKVAAAGEDADFREFVVERTDSIAHFVPADQSDRSETRRETAIAA